MEEKGCQLGHNYLRPAYVRGVSIFAISRIHINSTFEENFEELVAVRVRRPAPCKGALAQLGTACAISKRYKSESETERHSQGFD